MAGQQAPAGSSARIVITGEASGIRLGVIMLDTVQAHPEFCCQCGLRDAGGKVDSGKLYCRSCWELIEDMAALKESAVSEGAGVPSGAAVVWEERCAGCGKYDADGAADEADGNFYCGACWARPAHVAQGQVAMGSHVRGSGGGSPAGERCECARVNVHERI